MKQSDGSMRKICASESTLARMFACVIITPFGMPVLPLEKMTVASASDVSCPPQPAAQPRRRHQAGLQQRARSSTPRLISFRRSSRNTMPGSSGSEAFVEKRPRRHDCPDAGLRDRRFERLLCRR